MHPTERTKRRNPYDKPTTWLAKDKEHARVEPCRLTLFKR